MQPADAPPESQPFIAETNDGAELAAWSTGAPDGPAVVLLHGFSLDHTTWHPIAERLAADGYRVIAPDLRGHGRSTLGADPPSAQRLVADVATITAALELPAVHLVGHSLGAVIALTARTDLKPSEHLLSVTAIAGTEQAIQNPVMKLGARLFSSSFGIAMLQRQRPGRLMISSWFGKGPSTEQLDAIKDLSASCGRTTRQKVAHATADVDLRPSFTIAGPPTFVMAGERDKATPAKVSRRIADAIDGAELSVIDHAGHMVIIEDPDAVATQLHSWFSSVC